MNLPARRPELPANGGKRACRLSILVVAVCTLASCSRHTTPTLRVGLLVWPPYEMATLARKLGYFHGEHIKFIDYGAPVELVDAYERGDIDVMPMVIQYVFKLEEDHPGQRIIMTVDKSNGADALVANSQITSLNQLKGKRVGYEASALGAYMLTRALEHSDLSLSDIKPVPIDAINQASAFEHGLVDAVVTYEPTVTRLKAKGAHVLFDSSEIPSEVMDVMVTSQTDIQDKGSQINAFVGGWLKAVDYFKKYPLKAAKQVSRREQLTPRQFVSSFKGIILMDRRANEAYMSGHPSDLFKTIARQESLMRKNNLLNAHVALRHLPDPEFLRAG